MNQTGKTMRYYVNALLAWNLRGPLVFRNRQPVQTFTIKFPSYKAAILFGAIGVPIFVYILNVLENKSANQFAQLLWFFIGFGLPLLISTGDFKYIRREMKKGRPFFGSWTKSQDIKEFYFPAWKRMFVWFLAACISLLLLNQIGMDMS